VSSFAYLRADRKRGPFKITARFKLQSFIGEIDCYRLRGPFSPTTSAHTVEYLSEAIFDERFVRVRKGKR
jgi:hypothetical protein